MSIKEFCLVPRSDVEKKRISHHFTSQVKVTPRKQQQNSQNVMGDPLTPVVDNSIENAMKILLTQEQQQYADGIISYLRKHPIIRWDNSGNILSLISGVNLFDSIRYWANRNSNFDSTKIPDLRMMVKLIGLPETYIKNPKARKELFKGGRLSTKVKPKIKWDPY